MGWVIRGYDQRGEVVDEIDIDHRTPRDTKILINAYADTRYVLSYDQNESPQFLLHPDSGWPGIRSILEGFRAYWRLLRSVS